MTKQISRFTLIVVAILVCVFLFLTNDSNGKYQERIQQIEEVADNARVNVARLKLKIDDLNSKIDDIKSSLDSKIDDLESSVDDLEFEKDFR